MLAKGRLSVSLFLSTYINRIDRKGRVSVPAGFRAALSGQPFEGVVLIRSHNHPAMEGFSFSMMSELGERIDEFDIFSSEQDDLATAVFGEAVPLPFDGDGRVVLPVGLLEHAALEDRAAFIGLGHKFQIWAPEALERRRSQARDNVRDKGLTLPKGRPP